MIYNLIAFMIMVNVPKESIMKIVRTLVGKSRVTNCYATEITSLMSQLSNLVSFNILNCYSNVVMYVYLGTLNSLIYELNNR